MAQQNKIIIASEYHDLASEKIKQSFRKSADSADRFGQEIVKMRKSITRSMAKTRKETKTTMDGMAKSMRRTSDATKRTTTEMGKMRLVTKGLQLRMGQIRNVLLLVAFAHRLIIRPMQNMIKLMQEQEDVTRRMNFALKAQSTFSVQLSEDMIRLANAFQETTKYGNEAVQGVMQQLIVIGGVIPSKLDDATQAVLDFSAATGRDIASSTLLVAKAAAGFTGELSRYGIIIDANLPKSKKFEEVLKFISDRMGGAAQDDINTYSGVLAQLGETYSDFGKNLGRRITEFLRLSKVMAWHREQIKSLNEVLGEFSNLELMERELKSLNEQTTSWLGHLGRAIGIMKIANETGLTYKQVTARIVDGMVKRRQELIGLIAKEKLLISVSRDFADDAAERAEVAKDFQEQYNKDTKTRLQLTIEEFETRTEKFREHIEYLKSQADDYTAFTQENLQKRFGLIQEIAEKEAWLEQWLVDEKLRIQQQYATVHKSQLRTYLNTLNTAVGSEAAVMDGLMVNSAKGMTTALEDGFFKVVTGDFETMADVVADFGKMMLQVILKVIAQMIILRAFGGGLPFPSFGTEGVMGHTGSYIRKGLETSAGAGPRRRYHSGGEVAATLKVGEGVVNQRGMESLGVDNLNKLNRGESGGGGGQTVNNYYIQTIDERSFRERLEQQGDIFTAATEQDVKDNRSSRQTLRRFAAR